MTKKVYTVRPSDSIRKAIKMMDLKNIGALVVEEDGEPVGIITERDVIRRVLNKNKDLDVTLVKVVMTHKVFAVDVTATFVEVTKLMIKNNLRRVVILKSGKIAGILTAYDVVRFMAS
ncbi:CBS domain-containing protein [Candidatus Woesearchaeota archaeon]|nr:CBS domain-containing protein [Candidatus Woesearchaeota archaeon]